MIDPQDLADIKERAERATPGPWRIERSRISWYIYPESGDGAWICHGDLPFDTWQQDRATVNQSIHIANATHIVGLDPQTVLALVAEIERLTAERDMHRSSNAAHWDHAVTLACDERMTEQKHEIRRLTAELDRLARAICWDVPTDHVSTMIDDVLGALERERADNKRHAANFLTAICKIEGLLEIPEDERGYDFSIIYRAVDALKAERDAERERCAKIAETKIHVQYGGVGGITEYRKLRRDEIAERIRSGK